MSNKWSLDSNTTAGDRLLQVSGSFEHLSDGTEIFLAYDPSQAGYAQVKLYYDSDHVSTPTVIGQLEGGFLAPAGTNPVESYAVVIDGSDDIYVVGRSSTANDVRVQAWTKGAGYSWTAQTAQNYNF